MWYLIGIIIAYGLCYIVFRKMGWRTPEKIYFGIASLFSWLTILCIIFFVIDQYLAYKFKSDETEKETEETS